LTTVTKPPTLPSPPPPVALPPTATHAKKIDTNRGSIATNEGSIAANAVNITAVRQLVTFISHNQPYMLGSNPKDLASKPLSTTRRLAPLSILYTIRANRISDWHPWHPYPCRAPSPESEADVNAKMCSSDILRAQCPVPRDPTVLYANMLKVGLQYGPAFRLLSQVWIPEDVANAQTATEEVA